jgi:pimeloyl-ACP methyl ester carboxylesterase
VHFIHLRSPVADAVPVIMTHGWPGSFFEFEHVIQRLADPAAFGEPPRPAFHVVVPSLPGYGSSEAPNEPGWDIHRIAAAWAELMDRLGYSRFIALGSDWGTSISTCLALDHRPRLLGLHLIPPLVPPPARGTTLREPERAAIARLEERNRTNSAYSQIQATRPQTLGYSLVDSPVGLCAWILEKVWAWSDHQAPLGGPQSGPGAGQHHVVLAEPHGELISSVVLGEHRRSYRLVHQTRWRSHHRSDWMHRLPTGDTKALPPMGRTAVPVDRLLGRARARRPLRSLGTTGAVHLRSSRRIRCPRSRWMSSFTSEHAQPRQEIRYQQPWPTQLDLIRTDHGGYHRRVLSVLCGAGLVILMGSN